MDLCTHYALLCTPWTVFHLPSTLLEILSVCSEKESFLYCNLLPVIQDFLLITQNYLSSP